MIEILKRILVVIGLAIALCIALALFCLLWSFNYYMLEEYVGMDSFFLDGGGGALGILAMMALEICAVLYIIGIDVRKII